MAFKIEEETEEEKKIEDQEKQKRSTWAKG